MKKVIRNNKVAVLISYCHGEGWYTDNKHIEGSEQLLFHPKLVEMVEQGRGKEINKEWVKENIGLNIHHWYAAEYLKIIWLPVGTAFIVHNCEGKEILVTPDKLSLIV